MGLLRGSDDGDRAEALCSLAKSDPASAADSADELYSFFTSSDTDVLAAAADTCYHLASSHPDVVTPAIDQLLSALEDGDASVRRRAADALCELADSEPSAFSAWVESMTQYLSAADPYVRATMTGLYARLAASGPSRVLAVVDDIAAVVDDDGDWDVRVYATGALADVAARYPESVLSVVDDVVANAREPMPALQIAAVELLAAVGVDSPGAVRDDVDDLFASLLRDGASGPRRATALAAGHLACAQPQLLPGALDALTTTLADDDQEVARAAARAYVAVARAQPGAVAVSQEVRQRLWWLADDLDLRLEDLFSDIG
ncbi:hypothetical protein [Haloarchaeobius sp. DFWS5]|uniref:hypothetical protein n=1 Tax=Haloarchaeobius sp. DFWS5 TaxID=3446114 RepID=UPI003EB89B9C